MTPRPLPLMLRTPLHSLLPTLRVPLVVGPMANACSAPLACAVSHPRVGAFGFIGAGYYTPSRLIADLAQVPSLLSLTEADSSSPSPSPSPPRPRGTARLELGVGFLAWRLTQLNGGPVPPLGSSDLPADSEALQLIDAALRSKVRAIWLSFGSAEELAGWGRVVREREAMWNGMGRAKWGTELKMFVGVGSIEEARVAVEDVGADVVVVQGIEAGGHGLSTSPPLSSLLPLIRSRLPSWRSSSPAAPSAGASDAHTAAPYPLLLGAGGLHDGSTLLSTLALGAHGAVYGTRFLLTRESDYSPAQKALLLAAGPAGGSSAGGTGGRGGGEGGDTPGGTRRSQAFDEARGSLGKWPAGVDGRGLVNETVRSFLAGEGTPASRRERYVRAEREGDVGRIVTWAGTGVGNVAAAEAEAGAGARHGGLEKSERKGAEMSLRSAADVVREIEAQAVAEARRLAGYVVDAPAPPAAAA